MSILKHQIQYQINFEIIKPSTMRKVIAKRTIEAKQQIPHFYLTIESNVRN